jgi:hypothetical protein
VIKKGVLTGEVVGAVATDGVEGGNDSQVSEGAPNPASQLHTSTTDNRQSLAGDEKQGERSSPVTAEVTRMIHDGRQRSGLMIMKLGANGPQGNED